MTAADARSVALDEHSCPRENCERAYPHSLLVDKHLVDDHTLRTGRAAT